ncbi:membrane protein insertase YidC, partial [Cellulomonas endophytica]|uniref:membrane protein insertase YidC n=1 Tax=Cellulomonas endophytica TaxID=2494735 RepID=UPI00101095E0
MDWFDSLLWPIMVAVAWIMVQFHSLLTAVGLDEAGGASWVLSIVGLVIVIRILLIPLFFKQIKASRGLQMLSPELQAIQKKYKGKQDQASREAMTRETMELYRKHGTNPFSSCLPILAQSPIFFALFRVLNSLKLLSEGGQVNGRDGIGVLTRELASQAEAATVFGAPLSGTFTLAGDNWNTRVVTIVLILAMSATTFLTQRQLTMKNMPPSALTGPMAQQQKILLYVMPLIFAVSGVNFPIGVLVYWTTTNLWSMGQQFYTIRRMPAPGSQAEMALKERRARKARSKGIELAEPEAPVVEEKPRGQRQQPRRKDRGRPAGTAGATGTGSSAMDASAPGTGRPTDGTAPRAPRRPRPEGAAPREPRPDGASPRTPR